MKCFCKADIPVCWLAELSSSVSWREECRPNPQTGRRPPKAFGVWGAAKAEKSALHGHSAAQPQSNTFFFLFHTEERIGEARLRT
jgi:hypothetical protein